MKTLINNMLIVLILFLSFNAQAQFKFSNLEKVVVEKEEKKEEKTLKDKLSEYDITWNSIVALKKENKSDNITKVRKKEIKKDINSTL